jgi:hypothetical protein
MPLTDEQNSKCCEQHISYMSNRNAVCLYLKLHTFVKIIRLNRGKRLNFVIYPTNIADLWQILVYFADDLKGLE